MNRGCLAAIAVASTFVVLGCSSSDPAANDDLVSASASAISTDSMSSTTVVATSTMTRVEATSTSSTSTTTTTVAWQAYPSIEALPVSRPGEPVPRVARVTTDDKVVFLTIDDGIHRDPRVPLFLAEHRIPVSLFLNRGPMSEDPEYFRAFTEFGSTINSHTIDHPDLTELSYERQRHQICGMVDSIRATYGFSGSLFRPPYGTWNSDTRRAATSCGLAAVVTWNASLWEGNVDLAGRDSLAPGDIFLTHFRPDLYDNLVNFVHRVETEGFTVALLDRYLIPPVSGE